MIELDRFSYMYPGREIALQEVSLTIPDSTFVLVTGASGAGKSTLLRALNGLIPHFHGGAISGRVCIDGQDTLSTPTRLLARQVGFVFQDPEAQFVVERVEDELCFGMENAGIAVPEMGVRIDEVLRTLNITHLRHRKVQTLSGGEAQKVALASVLTLRPRHLILDEPTSQLDPQAAHDLMDLLVDLNCKHRLTIILAEHRVERILTSATHWLHLEAGRATFGTVREMLPYVPLLPPVIRLGLKLGWQPLPLTTADARPLVQPVLLPALKSKLTSDQPVSDTVIDCWQLSVRYGTTTALDRVNWQVGHGEIVGLLGRNGAGKSTLLKSLVGLVKPQHGRVMINGQLVQRDRLAALASMISFVPQNPNVVLFQETVRGEVDFTISNHTEGRPMVPETGDRILARYDLQRYAACYPRDLSGGERQRAALAAMLAVEPWIILLDEPTRGLDYVQKQRLAAIIRQWSAENRTVIIATHDVEWIAGLATRGSLLECGCITADGEIADILLNTPGFNTQLGELFQHPALMTVDQLEKLV